MARRNWNFQKIFGPKGGGSNKVAPGGRPEGGGGLIRFMGMPPPDGKSPDPSHGPSLDQTGFFCSVLPRARAERRALRGVVGGGPEQAEAPTAAEARRRARARAKRRRLAKAAAGAGGAGHDEEEEDTKEEEEEEEEENYLLKAGRLTTKPPLLDHTEQRGVLRSNCVDCLDRTNVAQVRCCARAPPPRS